MTHRLCLALLAATAALTPSTAAFADSTASVRAALVKNYKTADAAIAHRNIRGALSVCTKDCVFLDKSGSYSVADQIKFADAQLKLAKSASARTKIDSLTMRGGSAVAGITQDITMNIPAKGRMNKLQSHMIERDTWIQVGKAWRLKKSEVLHSAGYLNGQLMPGSH